RLGAACLIAAVWQAGALTPAQAQQPLVAPEAPAPAAEAATAGPTAMTIPAMTGPLVANPDPWNFELMPFGKIYATGAVSGLGLFQSNPVPPDRHNRFDI